MRVELSCLSGLEAIFGTVELPCLVPAMPGSANAHETEAQGVVRR
jgi:hypothetical protein